MQKLIVSLSLLIFSTQLFAQQKFTVSGNIMDLATGETMIGATVAMKEQRGVGTAFNQYGFYSLTFGYSG